MKRLVLLLLFIGTAQAAINGPLDFEADYAFAQGYTDGHITLISGSPTVDFVAANGTFAAFNVAGYVIGDLTRACWNLAQYYSSGQQDGIGCAESTSGAIEMRVVDNGSVAYQLPVPVSGQFTANHALGYPIDFAFQDKVKEMGLGQALLLSTVGGEMGEVAVPAFTGQGTGQASYGALAPINDQTVVEVYRDGVLLHTTGPSQQFLAFDSTIGATISVFQTPFALVPFENGSQATIVEAGEDAAREGFSLATLQDNLNNLAGASGDDAQELPTGLEDVEIILSEVLAGGIISVPGEIEDAAELIEEGELIRFEEIRITNQDGLAWTGAAPLQIRGGSVQGADSLVFLVPWWSFLLWGIAVALVITKLALKKPKKGPIDKFAWIGWLGTLLMSFLLFWLWDLEVQAIWGTSILSTSAGTEGMGVTALLRLVPWAIVAVAVTLPLRIIGSSAVNIAGLGKAARLPAVLMPVFGFLLGATLLLDFMGALLEFAVDKL